MKPLKILPCPEHSGKHPLHDCRYIVTTDTEVEVDEIPVTSPFGDQLQPDRSNWHLLNGSFIAKMTDHEDQKQYAHLFAAAPALLDSLQAIVSEYEALMRSQGAQANIGAIGSVFTAGEWVGSRLGGHIAEVRKHLASII